MVRHQKGHKNSNGELAEWVIVSHKDGHIISSHKTKAEAEKHLGDIRKFKHMGESMQLEEAKELLESEGYIVESFKEDLIAAFVTQCGENIWRKYYDRIMKNPEMAQYVKDASADGMSADEIVEYLLDWDEQLNEAKKPKIKLIFGIRKRKPGAKCKPAFATFEEADAYMDKFTYPQDFEIVNLLQHPELLEEDFTQGVRCSLGCRPRYSTFNAMLCSSNDEIR